jgi:hypothetical protein
MFENSVNSLSDPCLTLIPTHGPTVYTHTHTHTQIAYIYIYSIFKSNKSIREIKM